MTALTFQAALEKLVQSGSYREAVAKDGKRLQDDFALTDQEFDAMRQVAIATGWADPTTKTTACCCCCCPKF